MRKLNDSDSSLFSQMNRVKPEIGLAYLRDNNSMKQEEIEKEEIATEVDTPQGIVNFLQKRHGVFNFPKPVSRYSVTELVGCQRKSFYKQSGIEQEELLEMKLSKKPKNYLKITNKLIQEGFQEKHEK